MCLDGWLNVIHVGASFSLGFIEKKDFIGWQNNGILNLDDQLN
jgi:hypothetical protein